MATDEEMEDGWEKHNKSNLEWSRQAGWEPRIPKLEELELLKIHTARK